MIEDKPNNGDEESHGIIRPGFGLKMQNYIDSLELERHKILAFKRELPLSLNLVNQAIDSYKKKQEQEQTRRDHDQSHNLHLKEFIPIKTSSFSSSFSSSSSSHDDDNDEDHEYYPSPRSTHFNISYQTTSNSNSIKKSDWLKLSRLSLGNQTNSDHPPILKQSSTEGVVPENKNSSIVMPAIDNNTKLNNNNNNSKDHDRRKSRRCWSPDLHRRFVDALQNLGGPHVATPKQIREVMKVDGLTNDEIKSHLQKYRLHSRKPIPTTYDSNYNTQQQFVVVGGIWVPQTIPKSVEAMPSADGIPITKIFASLSSDDCRNDGHSSSPATSNSSTKKAQPTTTLFLS